MMSDPFDDLRMFYHRVDREVERQGWTCRTCGDCCRFTSFGHEVFCTQVEADYLLDAGVPKSPTAEGVCPFLRNNRCTRRARRMLPCRAFFCYPGVSAAVADLTEGFLQELKDLHRRWGLPWRYSRLADHLRGRK